MNTIASIRSKIKDKSILADYNRLSQITSNLMSNAIKFTEKGSVIFEISEQNESLVFKIQNTGIGMPDDSLEEVFEVFLKSITQKLSLLKELA